MKTAKAAADFQGSHSTPTLETPNTQRQLQEENVFFSGRNTKAQCASTEVATGTQQCCHFEHVLFCIPYVEWFCQRRQQLFFVQEPQAWLAIEDARRLQSLGHAKGANSIAGEHTQEPTNS